MKWTKDEEDKLIQIYSNTKNEDIAKILNKTIEQVERKGYLLKLKKTKEHLSQMISNRNKLIGRNLTYEELKNIALKYKTRVTYND
jgi:tRNA U34 5-carboxymethylaminomethyl modifying enzyme MnmG/GidA